MTSCAVPNGCVPDGQSITKGHVELSEQTFRVDKFIRRLSSLVILIPHLASYGGLVTNYLPPHMGRTPWATLEQLDFLYSKVSQLSKAKGTIGQKAFYGKVAQEFLEKWEPIIPTKPTASPEELKNEAISTVYKVRTSF